ncbi:MAG TPA: hypothetical protein VIY56_06250, partial [Vicinamibacterales bacterium]
MNAPHEAHLERRQFALLARDSVQQLLSSATMARDADPAQFALWATALALTPPFLVAVRKIIDYPFLLRAEPAYVERVILADRLFFILYVMLAMALVTALLWDALSPTRHDHEVVGVLPVRPRTLAAARLAAAISLCLGFGLAINVPSGLLYSAASAVHPLVGGFPRVLVGHLASTMLACVFVFCSLLTLRALVTSIVGDAIAGRLAVLLQIAMLVLLVQVFFFLPGLLPELMRDVQEGGRSYAQLPPMWFAGLFMHLAEGHAVAPGLAPWAMGATALSIVTTVVLTLVPAGLMRRRSLERRADTSTGPVQAAGRALVARVVRGAEVRALYLFALASLVRSRRHAVQLGTYAGLAVAAALAGLAAQSVRGSLDLTRAQPSVLALPLVAMFFGLIGLRSACAIPVDVDSNWPLRLHHPTVRCTVMATRLLLLSLGVLPPVLLAAGAHAWLWGAQAAGLVAVWNVTAGCVLAELLLASWTKVPFATTHEPDVDSLRTRWPWFVVALLVYGFQLAVVQVWALGSIT